MRFAIIVILLLLILASQGQCQTIYSNQYGQPIGSSTTVQGTAYYSNQYGQPVATARAPLAQPPMSTPTPPQIIAPATVLPTMPIMPVMPTIQVLK